MAAIKILYITFIDFGELKSGSSVRPQKMYEAFEKLGHEVKLLEGQQNRRNERKERVKKILSWLDQNTPDLCYVEPPAGPFFHRIDLTLLKKVHGMGIPVALFYRDAYWKFSDWWGVSGPKKWVLTYMHKRDLRHFHRHCDLIYFPSQSMADLFSFPRQDVLPPAGSRRNTEYEGVHHRLCYVGGITPRYGVRQLLEAIDMVRAKGLRIQLDLVCRQTEMDNLSPQEIHRDWLKIHHLSGDEQLAPIYQRADAGFVPLQRDRYMDFAICIKLFEYMGYGLPVIATDCVETKRIIDRYGCGLTCKDDAASMAAAIEAFYDDEEKIRQYRRQVRKAMEENQWENRAQKVVEDLSALKR